YRTELINPISLPRRDEHSTASCLSDSFACASNSERGAKLAKHSSLLNDALRNMRRADVFVGF
ncbi:MAG: hypothetical protein WBF49_09075, partial [Methyloceanibacter sp.]